MDHNTILAALMLRNRDSGTSSLPSGSSPNQYLVTDSEGNAKWEDKLCWSETAEEEIQPECHPELMENNDSFSRFYIDGVASITVGETYIVNWNGVEYRCVAKAPDMVSFDAASVYATLGNIAKMEETGDTGEPFVIRVGRYRDTAPSEYQIYAFDGSTELTLSIRHVVEAVHKMTGKLVEGMGWSEKSHADMTWDGVVPDGAASPYFHKVSEAINPSDLMGAIIETYVENTGDTLQFIIGKEGPYAEIENPIDGLYFCNDLTLTTKAIEFDGVSIPEAGVYFYRGVGGYPVRLSFPETIHPVDKKYLPRQDWYYYSTPDCVLYKDVNLTDAVTIADMEDVLSCGKFREVYDGEVGGDIRFAGGAFFNPRKTKGFKVSSVSAHSDGTVNVLELKSSDYKAAGPI